MADSLPATLPTGSDLSLEEVLALAQRYRATRIRIGETEVELSPLAFTIPAAPDNLPPQALAAEEGDACACGHSAITEHNGDGLCLHGCPVEACVKPEQPE